MQRGRFDEDENEEKKRKETRRRLKPALQKWLVEKKGQYSIEPVIIKRFPETENSMDVYVFTLPFGSIEIDEKYVEFYAMKPIEDLVDMIAKPYDPSHPMPPIFGGRSRLLPQYDNIGTKDIYLMLFPFIMAGGWVPNSLSKVQFLLFTRY